MKSFLRVALSCLVLACSSASPTTPPAAQQAAPQVQPAGEPALVFLDQGGQPVSSVLIRDRVSVRATGLRPSSRVTIEAEMVPWKSSATFEVGADGTVDSKRDAPAEGTYAGVDADGFFWSMNTAKFAYSKSADVAFRLSEGDAEIAKATLVRKSPASRVTTPSGQGFFGQLVMPEGKGPFATFVAFGGSEGGISGGLNYADDLVADGYAVLALAYFGEKGLPEDLFDIPLEYFDGALAWLKKQPEVDATRLGVIGGSRGGELALLLGSRIPELRAVVADVPSGYIWGGLPWNTDAWTVGGVALASIPSGGREPDVVSGPGGIKASALTPVFTDSVANASSAEREAARIPVEKAGASIALFGGGDDQLWPSCALAQVAFDKLVATGHAAEKGDMLECFAGAGHMVGAVGLPTTWSAFAPMPGGDTLALGGTPEKAARAGRERQEKLKAFLDRVMPARP